MAAPIEQRNPIDARHPELEAAIEANDDIDSYRVLADWLIARGDPRGELVVLQIAEELDPTPARAAATADLFERYKAYFLGPLGRNVTVQDNSGAPAFEWRRGFIYRAKLSQLKYSRFTGTIGEALAALLDHPSARFLRELSLGFNTPERDHQGPIDIVVSRAPRSLRALYLGPGADPEVEQHGIWRDLGDLRQLWPALPQLERLSLAAQSARIGDIHLPRLRALELRGPAADGDTLVALGQAEWPALERLVLWHGSHGSWHGGLAGLRAMFERLEVPRLEHFGLVHSQHADEACAQICGEPIVQRVRTLDLSRGTLTDAGAEPLARALGKFARLERLDVSRNLLTEQGITLLASVVPDLVAHEQRVPIDSELDDELFDY